MKKLVWITLLAFVLVMAASLTKGNACAKNKRTGCTVGVEDTPNAIVGNFSGAGIDTLVCVPYGAPDEWDDGATLQLNWEIKGKRGTCKGMRIEGMCEPELVFEGDLDGDGRDEFGFITDSPYSTMEEYRVFTYKDDEWKLLYTPLGLWEYHYQGLCEEGVDIVRPSGKKGFVTVHYTQFREDGDHRIKTKRVKLSVSKK